MKINYGKLFSARKVYLGVFNKTFRQFSLLIIFILVSALQLSAQEIRKNAVLAPNTSKITLRIKGLGDEKAAANLGNIFKECKGKVLEYSIDGKNNEATVIISDKLQPVDLLEVLEMHGISAGYLNDKKELVVLSGDGELAEPINITK